MMRRLLPSPTLSACLLATWLILNGSLSIGHCLLGTLLALVVPLATRHLRPGDPKGRHLGVILKLALRVARDIVAANVDVARRVLGAERHLHPAFVRVPLDVRSPHAAVSLMAVISLTPGTLSAELDGQMRVLLVHALHVDDEAALVAGIKADYEAPLKEIFE
jgi:multicomponent K+:H+ antiporter subunit E